MSQPEMARSDDLFVDCQKWFQFNALFARSAHVAVLTPMVRSYVDSALDLYGRS